jgi:hypothetical protein
MLKQLYGHVKEIVRTIRTMDDRDERTAAVAVVATAIVEGAAETHGEMAQSTMLILADYIRRFNKNISRIESMITAEGR